MTGPFTRNQHGLMVARLHGWNTYAAAMKELA